MLLVKKRELLLASVAGSSGPSVFNCFVNFYSEKPLDTEIFEQERRLAADIGTGRLALAVEEKSGASEVVYRAVTENRKVSSSIMK